jgi:CheY-like chemotaxis protein
VPAPSLRTWADGARVLLAEDNETNQVVAVGVLQELGYQVDVADDGVQALEMFTQHSYRAVLLDCQMPNMDGYQTADAIRRQEADTYDDSGPPPTRTPIIAMTAAALKGDRDRCYAAGMDDYLAKPFEAEDLAATLHHWIDATELTGQAAGVDLASSVEQEINERLDRLSSHVPPASIDRLLTTFITDGELCVSALQTTHAAADAEGLIRAAHTLKGAAGGVGAATLAAACQSLEDLVAAGNLLDAPAALTRLTAAYGEARDVLNAIAVT